MDCIDKMSTGAVAAWLTVQLAALIVSAWQVPLANHFPAPAEQLAAHVMLSTQRVAAAMLFPRLAGWKTPASLIATGWPFMALAGALGAAEAGTWASASLYVSLWLVGLTFWRKVALGQRWALVGSALAVAVSLGGALLWYLSREFGNPAMPGAGLHGPLVTGLALVGEDSCDWTLWIGVLVVLGSGAAAMRAAGIIRRKRPVGQCGNRTGPHPL